MNHAILIVDDEEAIRENLSAFFEDEGMRVTTAESGEKAIEIVQQGNSFDVCIMDMRLTGMDGNATIKAIARLSPGLQFLIHTGSSQYVLTDELRAIGMTDGHVFMKPLGDMGVMADKIRSLLPTG